MTLSLLFFFLAAGCYGICYRIVHGEFRYGKNELGFWGNKSARRKYKLPYQTPPDNWYYRLMKIDHKEKFPLSATILVPLVTGFHFVQFFTIKFLILAVVLYNDQVTLFGLSAGWQFVLKFALFWLVWLIGFNIGHVGTKRKIAG